MSIDWSKRGKTKLAYLVRMTNLLLKRYNFKFVVSDAHPDDVCSKCHRQARVALKGAPIHTVWYCTIHLAWAADGQYEEFFRNC